MALDAPTLCEQSPRGQLRVGDLTDWLIGKLESGSRLPS